jgi:hypothetical protein
MEDTSTQPSMPSCDLQRYWLTKAIELLQEIANHHFSIDGTPSALRTRYDWDTVQRMENYMQAIFTGESPNEVFGLSESELTFVRLVFTLNCRSYRCTTLKAQTTDWYQQIAEHAIVGHASMGFVLKYGFFSSLDELASRIARVPRKIEQRSAHQRRLSQAEAAPAWLPGHLGELARKVAEAVIDAFPDARPDPDHHISRTAAAVEEIRQRFASERITHSKQVNQGINAAREALQQAYNEIKALESRSA